MSTTPSYPNVGAVQAGDLFLNWQGGIQKNATASQIKNYLLGAGVLGTDSGGNLDSTFGLSTAAFAGTGNNQEVWLAPRTDGRTGTGLATDPFNASTQPQLDSYLGVSGSLSGSPYTIHFAAGLYYTNGLYLNVNSQLLGAGIDRTTIRLNPGVAISGQKINVIGSASPYTQSLTQGVAIQLVQDMTVDGNLPNNNLTNSPSNDLCIQLVSIGGSLRRVKAINGGNTYSGTNLECFWLFSGADGIYPSYNQIIEQCVCVAPNYTSYITFMDIQGGYTGTPATESNNCIIRDCYIIQAAAGNFFDGHGFTVANANHALIQNCFTDGISRPIYQDSYNNYKFTAINNYFQRVGTSSSAGKTGIVIYQGEGQFNDGIAIRGNVIEMEPNSSPGSAGIVIGGYPGTQTAQYVDVLGELGSSFAL